MTKKAAVKQNKNNIDYVNQIQKAGCDECPLKDTWDDLYTPEMPHSSSNDPLIYVMGESPSTSEDEKGAHFLGKTGSLLKKQIPAEFKSRVVFDNVIRCHPHANRKPVWEEIEACRNYHIEDIERLKPKIIIGAGGAPLQWVTGSSNITPWRGRKFPVRIGNHECWYYPVYHPSFIMLKGKFGNRQVSDGMNSDFGKVFQWDLENIFNEIEDLPDALVYPDIKVFEGIECLTEGQELNYQYIQEVFDKFDSEEDGVGLDIETNAIRPYNNSSKILSIAIGTENKTISIPLHHKQTPWDSKLLVKVEELVKEFVYHTQCRKICFNTGFEQEWLAHSWGKEIVRSGRWDDVKAQFYLLDEREGASSLDDVSLMKNGIQLKNYSNINVKKLDDELLEDVLLYNGGDTKHTHKLFYQLKEDIESEGFEELYEEQMRRVPTLVLAQLKGIDIDPEYVIKAHNELIAKKKETLQTVMQIPEVMEFEKVTGAAINLNSSPQKVTLMRDFIKEDKCIVRGYDGKPVKDKKGNIKYSTASTVLENVNHPFAKNYLNYGRYNTLYSRYVKPMYKDAEGKDAGKFVYDDGKAHTSFNCTKTSTRRLSSNDPNMQNQPKRTDSWLRGYFVPPKDHVILAADYGQIEARIIALASMDKTLIAALWDRYDIHTEWANRLFDAYPKVVKEKSLSDEKVLKGLRQDTKNKFVFPSFYGATTNSIAKNLNMPEDILKNVHKDFWKEFSGVKEWQEELLDFYMENHYIESLFSFRRRAPLSLNELINQPIQSTSSDIVVDAMNRLSEYAEEHNKDQFQAIINVHDDLTFAVPYDSIEEDHLVIARHMVNTYPFVTDIIPITIEMDIGENWADMEKIGVFSSDEDF